MIDEKDSEVSAAAEFRKQTVAAMDEKNSKVVSAASSPLPSPSPPSAPVIPILSKRTRKPPKKYEDYVPVDELELE